MKRESKSNPSVLASLTAEQQQKFNKFDDNFFVYSITEELRINGIDQVKGIVIDNQNKQRWSLTNQLQKKLQPSDYQIDYLFFSYPLKTSDTTLSVPVVIDNKTKNIFCLYPYSDQSHQLTISNNLRQCIHTQQLNDYRLRFCVLDPSIEQTDQLSRLYTAENIMRIIKGEIEISNGVGKFKTPNPEPTFVLEKYLSAYPTYCAQNQILETKNADIELSAHTFSSNTPHPGLPPHSQARGGKGFLYPHPVLSSRAGAENRSTFKEEKKEEVLSPPSPIFLDQAIADQKMKQKILQAMGSAFIIDYYQRFDQEKSFRSLGIFRMAELLSQVANDERDAAYAINTCNQFLKTGIVKDEKGSTIQSFFNFFGLLNTQSTLARQLLAQRLKNITNESLVEIKSCSLPCQFQFNSLRENLNFSKQTVLADEQKHEQKETTSNIQLNQIITQAIRGCETYRGLSTNRSKIYGKKRAQCLQNELTAIEAVSSLNETFASTCKLLTEIINSGTVPGFDNYSWTRFFSLGKQSGTHATSLRSLIATEVILAIGQIKQAHATRNDASLNFIFQQPYFSELERAAQKYQIVGRNISEGKALTTS